MTTKHRLPFFLVLLVCAALPALAFDVRDYGAKGDAAHDDTAAFQRALDAAAAAGGGIVQAPRGNYRFDGTLSIPREVTLEGIATYAPAHAGLRDGESQHRPEYGTVFLPYAGRGTREGTPFITINGNATLRGVTVHYPEQTPDAPEPAEYPWTVAMRDNNCALTDVQLLNPFQAIDARFNQRALIRNVHGQPIFRGILVDQIYDIGRIENVHWNPWWSINTPIFRWQKAHGIAFDFVRTDWHYVLNTFCFGYHIGYRFTENEHGATNGNFLGIGADDCETSIWIDQSAPMGILITNGEFVSIDGPDPTMVRVGMTHIGSVRFVNCAFWGPCDRIADIGGFGTVGFSDCTFMQWGHRTRRAPAIDVISGSVMLRGNEFKMPRPQIRLHPRVRRAIITDNLYVGDWQLDGQAGGNVLVRDNVGYAE